MRDDDTGGADGGRSDDYLSLADYMAGMISAFTVTTLGQSYLIAETCEEYVGFAIPKVLDLHFLVVLRR